MTVLTTKKKKLDMGKQMTWYFVLKIVACRLKSAKCGFKKWCVCMN